MACVFVYPMFWMVICTIDIRRSLLVKRDMNIYSAVYAPYVGKNMANAMGLPSTSLYVLFGISWMLPLVMLAVFVLFQSISLMRMTVASRVEVKERRTTLTVRTLTIVCLLCNTPYPCFQLYKYFAQFKETPGLLGVSYILGTALPIFNSAFNPIILLARSRALRQFVLSSIKGLSERIMGNETSDANPETEAVTHPAKGLLRSPRRPLLTQRSHPLDNLSKAT